MGICEVSFVMLIWGRILLVLGILKLGIWSIMGNPIAIQSDS
jgi:hypothetical protein